MDRIHVRSSNLRSVGYDPETETLEVEFQDGKVYQYAGVPESRHEGLMGAYSKGTYFGTFIKKGVYRNRRIR